MYMIGNLNQGAETAGVATEWSCCAKQHKEKETDT
jgi:hypothetical protein